MQDMRDKIETLLEQNASLQQQLAATANPATNGDTSDASEVQEPQQPPNQVQQGTTPNPKAPAANQAHGPEQVPTEQTVQTVTIILRLASPFHQWRNSTEATRPLLSGG